MRKKYHFIWVIAIYFLLGSVYRVADGIVLMRQGLNVWNCMREQGSILGFYSYCIHSSIASSHANYSFIMYVFIAIWNLPMLLLENIGVNIVYNPYCILWGKLLFAGVNIANAYLLKQIAKSVGMTNTTILKWLPLYYLTSSLVLFNVAVMGQSDSIVILFTLLGIKAFFDKKDVLFLLFFFIGISCKFFVLIIFVTLLLARYKRLRDIAIRALAVLGGVIIGWSSFYVYDYVGIREANNFFSNLMDFFTKEYVSFLGGVPFCAVLLTVIWCYTFIKKNLSNYDIIALCFLSYGSLFLVSYAQNTYWYMHLTPFFILLLCANWRSEFWIISTIADALLVVGSYIHASNYFSSMIYGLPFVGDCPSYDSALLTSETVYTIERCMFAVYGGVLLFFMIYWGINILAIKKKQNFIVPDEDGKYRMTFYACSLCNLVGCLMLYFFAEVF